MKSFLLTAFGMFCISIFSWSQCNANETEITFEATCNSADCAMSIYITAPDFSLQYASEQFPSQTNVSQSYCIPSDACALVSLYYDGFGSADIDYTISVNGTVQVEGNLSGFSMTHFVNCPEGSLCGAPIVMASEGTYTTTSDDTWFSYTPTVTGLYHISTCDYNTCDTKIWVYETCPWSIVEGPPGTYAFNDEGDCGIQAETDLSLQAGDTYLIRVGDNLDNCTSDIMFDFAYLGPIVGCMDPLACNYDPMAQASGDCLYFPNADCSSPDLVMNVETLLTSMMMMDVAATACDVEEGMVTGEGMRKVITFSVRIDNQGEADYYIGNPSDNPEMFETVNCHGHTHYAGYGDYRLMDMQGNIIPAGHKNGFCVMDLCGFGQYNCGAMGISAGCYDQYGAGTSGQWFDITDVPDGTYRGLVTVNPLHLPDALGRQESDYENNTYVFCFDILTGDTGARTFNLLGNCPAFVDCMGIENGTTLIDCNGICGGPSIWGDVVSDSDMNTQDLTEYISMLSAETLDVTTCNDLSANGSITIYDLALANICIGESELGGTSACNFPHNILSMSSPVGMAITDVNFDQGYIDVELKSTQQDIIAYQFTIEGIVISSVVSLADATTFPCAVGFNPYTNSIFGLGEYTKQLDNGPLAHPVCRIYYSQILSNTICINGITDIVNAQRSRTANYIYGECFDATAFSTNEIVVVGEISIMPNPATDVVTIGLNRFVTAPRELALRDQVGKLVTIIPVPQGARTLQYDMTTLPSGIYTISSERNGQLTNVSRLIKL